MRRWSVSLFVLVVTHACIRLQAPNPAAPTPVSVTITTTNTNTQDVTTPITIAPPASTTPTPITPAPGTGAGNRTADPPAGTALALPLYAPGLVRDVAAQHPELLPQSCVTTGGVAAWAFLDLVVDTLRTYDTRWGYACALGDCVNPIPDAIAYHAAAGPEAMGVTGVWVVDIIESYCLLNPSPGFLSLGYQPAGRWSTRNRF